MAEVQWIPMEAFAAAAAAATFVAVAEQLSPEVSATRVWGAMFAAFATHEAVAKTQFFDIDAENPECFNIEEEYQRSWLEEHTVQNGIVKEQLAEKGDEKDKFEVCSKRAAKKHRRSQRKLQAADSQEGKMGEVEHDKTHDIHTQPESLRQVNGLPCNDSDMYGEWGRDVDATVLTHKGKELEEKDSTMADKTSCPRMKAACNDASENTTTGLDRLKERAAGPETLLVLKGEYLEKEYAKDGTLLDPATADNAEVKCNLQLLKDPIPAHKKSRMVAACHDVSEEATTGLHMLKKMAAGPNTVLIHKDNESEKESTPADKTRDAGMADACHGIIEKADSTLAMLEKGIAQWLADAKTDEERRLIHSMIDIQKAHCKKMRE